jgi:hypothetical protein
MRKHLPIFVALCIALGLHAVALAGTFQQGTATRTYERRSIRIDGGGTSFSVDIAVLNAGGRLIDNFEVRVPASGAIVDSDGNQLAASVPAGIASARASFLSAIDSAIDSAAAAGKFAR